MPGPQKTWFGPMWKHYTFEAKLDETMYARSFRKGISPRSLVTAARWGPAAGLTALWMAWPAIPDSVKEKIPLIGGFKGNN